VPSTDHQVQVPANSELELGMVCIDKSRPGRTVWQMAADERFANPAGSVQGGFLAALCDTAMGSATVTWARAQGRRVFSANAEIKVSFLGTAMVGTMLTCRATVVSGGRRVVFAEAEVVDGSGRAVARASSTYVLTERGGGTAERPPSAGAAAAPEGDPSSRASVAAQAGTDAQIPTDPASSDRTHI